MKNAKKTRLLRMLNEVKPRPNYDEIARGIAVQYARNITEYREIIRLAKGV